MNLKTYINDNYSSQIEFARVLSEQTGKKVYPQAITTWIAEGRIVAPDQDGNLCIWSKRVEIPKL